MTDGNPPKIGHVWRYPYLWSHEAVAGRIDGAKLRADHGVAADDP